VIGHGRAIAEVITAVSRGLGLLSTILKQIYQLMNRFGLKVSKETGGILSVLECLKSVSTTIQTSAIHCPTNLSNSNGNTKVLVQAKGIELQTQSVKSFTASIQPIQILILMKIPGSKCQIEE